MAALLAGWGFAPAAPATEPVPQTAANAEVEEDEWMGLPAGPGREEVFYLCQACHSLAIVKQQGLDRASWDETVVWMVEEHGMEPLEPADLELVLDYLAGHYGRD